MAESKKKETKAAPVKAEPKPKDPMVELTKDMAALVPALDEQIVAVESDRIRQALLRVHSAITAFPDAVQTDTFMERD